MFNKVVLTCLTTFIVIGCKRQDDINVPKVDETYAYQMVQDIVKISPRVPGSLNSKKIVKFLESTSKKFADKVYVENFTAPTPFGETTFRNVTAEITGLNTSQYVIIGSHFDTKQLPGINGFQGANDGGSSTAVLLAMMKAIKDAGIRPPISMRFVFFDGEECYRNYTNNDGLYGSKQYAKNLEDSGELKACRAMILLDMIGDKKLTYSIPINTDSKLHDIARTVAKNQGVSEHLTNFNGNMLDDFIPFQKRGIACIDLIDFDFGPHNAFWHTSEDSLDKISPNSLKITGNLALGIVWQL